LQPEYALSVGERAELLEIVDVEEDLHLRRERGEPPLDHVHLVGFGYRVG